jgi:hypothetical protein
MALSTPRCWRRGETALKFVDKLVLRMKADQIWIVLGLETLLGYRQSTYPRAPREDLQAGY